MNSHRLLLAAASISLLLAGCATTTRVYDPETQRTNIRNEHTVSSEEFRQAAVEAVRDAFANPRFARFLAQFRAEAKDPNAIPVLKLAPVINDTEDSALNVAQLTDIIKRELINAAVVDVTLAEGAERVAAIADSRNVQYDPNFNQATTAKTGTLIAARLVMRPKVISNRTYDGRRQNVVRTFTIDMADIHTGMTIWTYTKQLGFVQSRAVIGY